MLSTSAAIFSLKLHSHTTKATVTHTGVSLVHSCFVLHSATLYYTFQVDILKFLSSHATNFIIFVFISSSSVPHTRSLEARVKEELVAQGLLDSEERPGPGGDSEDEVLAELQKRQAELKALSAHNRARKQELLR